MQRDRRRIWLLAVSLVFAVAIIVGLSVFENILEEEEEQRALLDIPHGWKVLLRGDNFMAMVDQGDLVWAGGRNGVYKIDRRKAELIERIEFSDEVTYVTSLLIDNNDMLWVSYENGLVTWDGKEFNYYNTETGLPDNRANFVTQDSNGNVWVGTWGGAAFYDGNAWQTISTEDGLSVSMVNVILEDSFGNFWFGAYNMKGGAISILMADGSWQYFSMENGLPNDNVTGFLELEKGSIWVGTGFYNRGGAAILSYEEGKYHIKNILKKKDGLAGEKVRSLYQDNLGNIWFGSEFDGIAIMNESNMAILTEDEGLSHNEVLSILQVTDGDMWLGTLDGITIIEYDLVKKIHVERKEK